MPSDRLTRFRQYMAAFEGAADPAKSIALGHYVHAPGQLFVDQISGRLALRPNSSHLLVGSIGSGKTTQLLIAQQQLNQIEDLITLYVDVSSYIDVSQLDRSLLMTIVGLQIATLLPESLRDSCEEEMNALMKVAYGYTETRKLEVQDPVDLYFRAVKNATKVFSHPYIDPPRVEHVRHKGLFSNARITNNFTGNPKLEQNVKRLLKALNQHTQKKIILLIDGLDRLDDVKKFSQILQSDIQGIKELEIGIVIIGSMLFIHSEYQEAKDLIDYFYYQPCFDVEQDATAKDFFEQVIHARLPEIVFFGEATISSLIHYSGGVLRDLITLAQAAIEEVYIAGDETLEIRHTKKAIQTLAKSKMLGISEEEVAILRNHLRGEGFVLGSPESLQLLVSRRILEYNYPTVRYVVHPAIVPLLDPVFA
jgi:hypothetical protein